jgi:hypothetical protein
MVGGVSGSYSALVVLEVGAAPAFCGGAYVLPQVVSDARWTAAAGAPGQTSSQLHSCPPQCFPSPTTRVDTTIPDQPLPSPTLTPTPQYRKALDVRQGLVLFHRSGDAPCGLHGNSKL